MDWSEIASTLGYYNYKDVIADGVISSIETVRLQSISGEKLFETRTSLNIITNSKPNYDFYGNIDGTGTARLRLVSQLKSISESLERLAFYTHHQGSMFGFDIEKTTTGMAAIPKTFSEHAPVHATNEAIERWAIIEWWSGRLKTTEVKSWKEISYFQIYTPFNDSTVVIAFTKNGNNFAYGFAASNTLMKALKKAIIELDRNIFVLSRIQDKQARQTDELRLLYFAKDDGFKLFTENHRRSLGIVDTISMPTCVFNGKISGVWDKYACVWRKLYEYSSYDFLNPTNNFFIF